MLTSCLNIEKVNKYKWSVIIFRGFSTLDSLTGGPVGMTKRKRIKANISRKLNVRFFSHIRALPH